MSAIIKEVYDAFKSAGVSEEQATAAAQAIPLSRELVTQSDLSEFQTLVKSDFSEFQTIIKNDNGEFQAQVRSDLSGFRAEFKSDVDALDTKIEALRAELKNDIDALDTKIEKLRAELKNDIATLRAETRADLKDLELRMTRKFYAAVGLVVAGIKALDFLIG